MDEEHYQDPQRYEPYDYHQYHEEFIGHHNEAIAPGNHHGTYQKVSSVGEHQFLGHEAERMSCTGDIHCAWGVPMET